MALLDEGAADIAVITLECPEGRFPSVGLVHPPAIRLERAIHDLWGLEPDGATRPAALARSRSLGNPASARRERAAAGDSDPV